jgi:hypothetical protein
MTDVFEDTVMHISQDGSVHAIDVTAGDGDITFDLRSWRIGGLECRGD